MSRNMIRMNMTTSSGHAVEFIIVIIVKIIIVLSVIITTIIIVSQVQIMYYAGFRVLPEAPLREDWVQVMMIMMDNITLLY